MSRLLIIDDDTELQALLSEYLAEQDFECGKAIDGLEGLRLLGIEPWDAATLRIPWTGAWIWS